MARMHGSSLLFVGAIFTCATAFVGCGYISYDPIRDGAVVPHDLTFYQPDAIARDSGADSGMIAVDGGMDSAIADAAADSATDDLGTADSATPSDAGIDLAVADAGIDLGPDDMGVDLGPDDMGVDLGPPDMGPVDMGPALICTGLDTVASAVIGTATVASAAAADFNNDGFDDVLVVGNNGDISVNLSNGDGTFDMGTTSLIMNGETAQINSIAVADLNKDGALDVIYGNKMTSDLTIAIAQTHLVGGVPAGTGAFNFGRHVSSVPPASTVVMSGGSIVVADFNNDTFPDIATADDLLAMYDPNQNALADRLDEGGYLSILLNNKDGTGYGFTPPVAGPAATPGATFTQPAPLAIRNPDGSCPAFSTTQFTQLNDLVVSDFNHDGLPDLAWAGQSWSGTEYTTDEVGLAIGDGAGGFNLISGDCGAYGLSSRENRMIGADWDGDGFKDLIIAEVGDSTGSFAIQTTRVAIYVADPTAGPATPFSGLFRSDSTEVSIPSSITMASGADFGWSLGVRDFSCDGKADIIMKRSGVGLIDLYTQDATDIGISMTTPQTITGVINQGEITVTGDFDNDGRGDFAVFNGDWGNTSSFQVVMNH